MDRGKILRVVLIPLIIGLVVTLIVRQALSGSEPSSESTAALEMVSVVATATKEPIPAKVKLTEAHLILKAVPKAFVTGSEFTQVKDLVGQTTLVQLEPGEVVLRSRVVPEGKGALPYRIPAGTRAVTIRIDELTGVAGHPETGDLVDLVLILPAKMPERPNATSRILYESVKVLGKGPADSVQKPAGPEGVRLTSLTLALKPEAAVEVALAEQIGLVKVLLRPAQTEPEAGRVIMTDGRYLPSGGAPAPVPNR